MILVSVFAAAASFALGLILQRAVLRLAHRRKWYDTPNRRKIHTGLIPRLGGPGILISFAAAAVLASALSPVLGAGRFDQRFGLRFLFPLGGLLLMHGVGLYDDFRNLRALFKFSLHLLAATIVVGGGFLIRTLTVPYLGVVSLGVVAYPLTVIWIVAITNAINLIDGMDGLAGGIAAFAVLAMGVIAFLQGAGTTALLCFSLFGAIAAFLAFNLPPAKLFMGDSGSYMLGFSIAVLPLIGGISKAAAFGTLMVPITLLTVPIVDTCLAILRRLRHKRSIVSPDKEHVHHKLLALGLSERQILTVIYAFSAYLGVVSISSVVLPKEIDVYLIAVVWAGSLFATWLLYIVGVRNRTAGRQEAETEDSSSSDSSHTLPRSG